MPTSPPTRPAPSRRRARGRARRGPVVVVPVVLVLLVLALGLAGCSSGGADKPSGSSSGGSGQSLAEQVAPPELGDCRALTPTAVAAKTNATPPVACSSAHTAQTFAVGTLPADTGTTYDDPRQSTFVYSTCDTAFQRFLGFDESGALRATLSWAWFRPTTAAWAKGARWFRCDLVGGADGATSYQALPADAKGLFSAKPPDHWLMCVDGATVSGGEKVTCDRPHTWRAVTTIKVGQPQDPYPGDKVVAFRTKDFCSDSVGAYLSYPPSYDYGYTWFRSGDWKAGNRRSICWAKTDQ